MLFVLLVVFCFRQKKIYQDSRVVKGGRLKIYCVSFVGSNPTPDIIKN